MTYNKNDAINLINEARSQARADKVFNFIRANKKIAITVAVVILIALTAFFILSIVNKSLQKKYSENFHQALLLEDQNDYEQALKTYNEICQGSFVPAGVQSLSCLRFAGISYNLGKENEALEVYKKLANGSRYDDYVQELSALLATKIMAIAANDKTDKKVIANNLKQIQKFAKHSDFLQDLILEQEAIFLMNAGELEKSAKILEEILKSEKAEQTLKERVSSMMQVLNSKGYIKK